MRLLMRDGAEPKQIEYAIAWMDGASEGGLFWAENVRTPKKLRESGWRSWPTSAARARAAPRGAGRPDVELSVASSARRSPRWSDEGARQPESGASAGTGQLSPAPPSPTWAQWLRIAGLIDEWWPASEFDEGHIRAYFPELDRHSADEVQAAVRACLHDGSAFAPSLAQLMVKLERPVIELPAWVMVYNRLRWAVEREVGENAAIQALFREHAAIAQCVIEYGYDRLRAEPFTDTQLAGVVRSA